MNRALLSLLGQQAGVPVASDVAKNIQVVGRRPVTAGEEEYQPSDAEINQYDALLMDNTEAIRKRKRAVEAGEAEADRRGMFGVGGTLRDVLGLVGDSFLMGQGKDPMYQARRDKERISDAGAGFSVNPRAAAERIGYYDPEAGRKALSDYEQQELRKAQQQSLQNTRDSQIEARDLAAFEKSRESIARLLNNPNAYGPDGNLTPEAEAIAGRLAAGANRSLEDFDVRSGMNRTRGSLIASTGATVNQQNMLPLTERRVAASEKTAEAAERNSKKPRAGSRDPNPTPTTMLRDFMAIPPEQRTTEQQNFIDRNTEPTGGGRRRPSSPSSTSRRFGPPRN
jgi:hypothetical protein